MGCVLGELGRPAQPRCAKSLHQDVREKPACRGRRPRWVEASRSFDLGQVDPNVSGADLSDWPRWPFGLVNETAAMHAAPRSLSENEVAARYQDAPPITHLNAPFRERNSRLESARGGAWSLRQC
jgi:hypothetical protein